MNAQYPAEGSSLSTASSQIEETIPDENDPKYLTFSNTICLVDCGGLIRI